MRPSLRILAALSALTGAFALTLQYLLSTRLTTADGRGWLPGLWLCLGYFTILTNLFCTVTLAAAAIAPQERRGWLRHPGTATAAAISIVIVALVYQVLLHALWHPHGWALLADLLLHRAMPLLFLLYWWLAVPKAALGWPQIGTWLLYPAAYFVYALARGAIDGWYPYPFLDVAHLGYARVLLNACAMLLAFVTVALVLLVLSRWQHRRLG
ncbi:Pr6Pr family membrane protein [Dyella sp. A6]|uniref:Pr6Pr family membrane protein n=1 Tax=Dyella aluminiiresistens TaxID=3069105 RepID=UPI002E79C609|nr:Pr6Pr family membrane protein [Dyella sp. A6]